MLFIGKCGLLRSQGAGLRNQGCVRSDSPTGCLGGRGVALDFGGWALGFGLSDAAVVHARVENARQVPK